MGLRVKCPHCRGVRFVDIGSGWVECVSDVPYSGAPPELTGLPHPIHQFGPCGHRFQPATVIEAEVARQERAALEAEAQAKAEAAERVQRAESIEILKKSGNVTEILEALSVREGLIPAAILEQTWLRLLRDNALEAPNEEIVTIEGRGTILGYFLSRGTFTTQWGKWTEREREPVFRAPESGRSVRPRYGEIRESVIEGFDVWFDASGGLWACNDANEPRARLALGGTRATERLLVERGKQLTFTPRKANWQGWETLVPGAQTARGYSAGDAEYARALKAVLTRHRSYA